MVPFAVTAEEIFNHIRCTLHSCFDTQSVFTALGLHKATQPKYEITKVVHQQSLCRLRFNNLFDNRFNVRGVFIQAFGQEEETTHLIFIRHQFTSTVI